jgi:hypothetical protein
MGELFTDKVSFMVEVVQEISLKQNSHAEAAKTVPE